jgi:pantoate--beta-alanine ligase
MRTVSTISDLRSALLPWREGGETVGFVPTMGALHAGHMALVAEAKKKTKRVVASIFVNPMQFAPTEDLAKYPRQLADDQKKLIEAGCDLLYAPGVEQIYPQGFVTSIDPGPLATVLEGVHRPGHFRGVATVVVKLLLQLLPDAAFFGEKDYQQLMVIRQVVRDLDMPIHIIGVPTLRDADGLALSSRNIYLSTEERQRAAMLPKTLHETAASIKKNNNIESALKAVRESLAKAGFAVDYLELADAVTLASMRELTVPARLLVAAKIGTTRLIDNIAVI